MSEEGGGEGEGQGLLLGGNLLCDLGSQMVTTTASDTNPPLNFMVKYKVRIPNSLSLSPVSYTHLTLPTRRCV